MAEAELEELQRRLLFAQNADGGWGYHARQSWTEPTALAALALRSIGYNDPAFERAIAWLLKSRRSDGGWAPTPSVQSSTSVTSLAFLAAQERLSPEQWSSSLLWARAAIFSPPSPLERSILCVLGQAPAKAPGSVPWFPGTAGWVVPTALSLVCLRFVLLRFPDPTLYSLATESREFLLRRRCMDGGWNHGGSSYRSENACSYPETTGLALLALGGTDHKEIRKALELARRFALQPASAEGAAWLRLALAKHGVLDDDMSKLPAPPCRDPRDLALRILALTSASDHNRFMAA